LKTAAIKIVQSTGKASGKIVVDAASGQSDDSLRDSRMRNSVLEVGQYPEITFVARRAELEGRPRGPQLNARLIGALVLHGSSHEFTLHLMITRQGNNFMVKTHFVIPYVSWGLEDPSVLFLTASKQVDIDVTSAGHVSWTSQPTIRKGSSANTSTGVSQEHALSPLPAG
jgi:hypothetical protein